MFSVVFVDDDELIRTSICAVLDMFGIVVQDFSNGIDALNCIERGRPDAVLLDLNMPAMDGFEVARRVRAQCGTSLRLVALTAVDNPRQREAARMAGFDEFLTKPASGAEIVAALMGERSSSR